MPGRSAPLEIGGLGKEVAHRPMIGRRGPRTARLFCRSRVRGRHPRSLSGTMVARLRPVFPRTALNVPSSAAWRWLVAPTAVRPNLSGPDASCRPAIGPRAPDPQADPPEGTLTAAIRPVLGKQGYRAFDGPRAPTPSVRATEAPMPSLTEHLAITTRHPLVPASRADPGHRVPGLQVPDAEPPGWFPRRAPSACALVVRIH
jgi:hypothetical protein